MKAKVNILAKPHSYIFSHYSYRQHPSELNLLPSMQLLMQCAKVFEFYTLIRLCTLESSILKMLHIFRHTIMIFLLFCFAACLPATVLHDSTRCMGVKFLVECGQVKLSDARNIECDTCGDWYHLKCVGLEKVFFLFFFFFNAMVKKEPN